MIDSWRGTSGVHTVHKYGDKSCIALGVQGETRYGGRCARPAVIASHVDEAETLAETIEAKFNCRH